MLDAIVPIRGGANEELRYARRSWAENLPYRTVVTAGGRPSWLSRHADHMDVAQDGPKHANAWRNLRTMLRRSDLTEDVIVLMDDIFVMEPVAAVPSLHRGPLAEVLADYAHRHPASPYTRMMAETKLLLERWGFSHPLSYSLHMPMVVNRLLLSDLLDRLERETNDRRYQWRTLYGNLYVEDAEYSPDCKIYTLDEDYFPHTPFLSTLDTSFNHGAVGRHIREAFPAKDRFELC